MTSIEIDIANLITELVMYQSMISWRSNHLLNDGEEFELEYLIRFNGFVRFVNEKLDIKLNYLKNCFEAWMSLDYELANLQLLVFEGPWPTSGVLTQLIHHFMELCNELKILEDIIDMTIDEGLDLPRAFWENINHRITSIKDGLQEAIDLVKQVQVQNTPNSSVALA